MEIKDFFVNVNKLLLAHLDYVFHGISCKAQKSEFHYRLFP